MSTRSVINWAIISGFGRPPLQISNLAGNNWESWGGRGSDVIQSRQQKQLGYFSMRQVSSWKVFAVVFLRIRSKFVVLCRIATTVQTREKEFLYIILLPAAVFYQVGRDSCHRKNFNPTSYFVFCSEHITDDCFARSYHVGASMKRLVQGAIPSVWKKKLKTIYFLVIVAL